MTSVAKENCVPNLLRKRSSSESLVLSRTLKHFAVSPSLLSKAGEMIIWVSKIISLVDNVEIVNLSLESEKEP